MWFIFLPLKQLSCFGNNNNNISSSSIPNTLWCLFWLWVDKKSVHAKIKCSFFALSLYIYCAFKIHPQHMNNMCFRKLKIKHIVFICSSSSTTHMLLLLHFVEYTFQLCECCIQKKWTWHICLISTVAHLAFVNFFPHEIHSREWVKLIPRIIFVAVH